MYMINANVYSLTVNKEANIFVFDLTSEIDSNKIASDVLAFRSQFPESNKSNIIGWHSGYFAHKQSHYFDDLIKLVESKATKAINDKDFNISVVQSWAIVYEKGNGAAKHSHADTLISAVFYADVEASASPLKFENGPTILPEKGMLVIFPGWLKHEVPPMRFDSKRIAIAFNLNCTLKTFEERMQ